jgi:hypothetical protein
MSKTDILLSSINSFYNEEKNRTKLLNILDKKSGIFFEKSGMVYYKLCEEKQHNL